MLEYPYRTRPAILVGIFIFFAACLAVFATLLLGERQLPGGFFGIAVGVAALSTVFVVATPYVLLRSRANMLRMTERQLSIDSPFGGVRRIALADIAEVKVQGTGAQRSMTVSGAGTRLPINQMMLPDAAAFDAVLGALPGPRV